MNVNMLRSVDELAKAVGVSGVPSYIDIDGVHAIVIPIKTSKITNDHITLIHNTAASCVKSLDAVDFLPLVDNPDFVFQGGHAAISYEFPYTCVILSLEV